MRVFVLIISFLFFSSITDINAEGKNTPTSSYNTFSIKGGKWVAEYGGFSTPFRCKCISALFKYKCVEGDISADLSLCE